MLLKEIGAYVINDDIVHIKHSLRCKRNYYILGTDSGENLDTGLRIYRKYSDRSTDRVNMWIYSKNELSEVVFDYLYETFNVRSVLNMPVAIKIANQLHGSAFSVVEREE